MTTGLFAASVGNATRSGPAGPLRFNPMSFWVTVCAAAMTMLSDDQRITLRRMGATQIRAAGTDAGEPNTPPPAQHSLPRTAESLRLAGQQAFLPATEA